jgi:hypothetical protein
MDVVFVVDASGSVGPIDYLIILNFVSRVVGMLDVDSGLVRVGLLMFGSESRVVFNLNRYSSVLDIQAALAQVRYVGRVDYDGARSARGPRLDVSICQRVA